MLNFVFLYIILNSKSFTSHAQSYVGRFRELLQELSGSHLRLSATNLPPLLSIIETSNGTFSYQGLHVVISDFLAGLLNITYSFVNPHVDEENQVGLKEAAVNLLIRKKVEIVTYGLGISFNHWTRVDCSCPLTASPYGLMVPWPEKESRLLAPIKPFQSLIEQLLYAFMDDANKRAGYCRFTISNMNLPISSTYLVYAFHKNWRYTDAINYKMQFGWESGLFRYWIRTYEPKIDKCLLDHYRDATPKLKNFLWLTFLVPLPFYF